jgi:hypothetical protein
LGSRSGGIGDEGAQRYAGKGASVARGDIDGATVKIVSLLVESMAVSIHLLPLHPKDTSTC